MLIRILAKLFGIGKFRKVILHFEGGSTSEYIVHQGDFRKLIKATLQLHFDPGTNPYSMGETAKVIKITAQTLKAKGPYWWSTPGLDDNPFGAVLWEWSPSEPKTIWKRPENR